MSAKTKSRLTPRERLARGLTYSAVGPVDVVWGAVGVGAKSAQSAGSQLRRRYQQGRLAREVAAAQETVAQELAAAQEVVASLPQALQDARRARRRGRRPRPWVIAGAAVVVLAAGGAAFSIVRRSTRPDRQEPSPRPPSVDVQPRP